MNTLDASQAASALVAVAQPLSALGYMLPADDDLSPMACDERCRVLRQFVERATAAMWRERAAARLKSVPKTGPELDSIDASRRAFVGYDPGAPGGDYTVAVLAQQHDDGVIEVLASRETHEDDLLDKIKQFEGYRRLNFLPACGTR